MQYSRPYFVAILDAAILVDLSFAENPLFEKNTLLFIPRFKISTGPQCPQ